ncbi:MAG TPA: hypothetical protein VK831_07705 [Candidatus Deferrimicrobiaceae bacterium]|nr:hypothetical protein [Candidatus Deferrimicrobiaceae bacterium]
MADSRVPPVSSRRVCAEAVSLYDALFHRYDPVDFDAGFEQEYEVGSRWLRARAEAADWALPDQTAARVAELFRFIDDLRADEVDEWLARFPRAFVALLERRQVQLEVDVPRRRVLDRLGLPGPAPRVESLVGVAVGSTGATR